MLRKKLMVLLMALVLALMSAYPAMAAPKCVADFTCKGNKLDDGADKNKGGGQEHIRNAHPDHGGGDQHGGGSV
jgi:hypothetical protein